MSRRLIFISSVQKELQPERIAMRNFIRGDALLRKQFDVFLFEELPASDRKADDVYLEMVEKCDVYVGIFGNEYGKPNSSGISPTEQEYQLARDKAKYQIILVKGTNDSTRDERMTVLIHKAQNKLIRKRFSDPSELIALLYASLVDYLEQQHVITSDPFDAAINMDASVNDIDSAKIAWFLKKVREERNYPLSENTPPVDALLHLNLMHQDRLKNSALLLFAKQPQRFFVQAETKCFHYHGTIVAKPIPSYQIFKGTVFDQVDASVDFVLSKLNRSVTPQNDSPSSAVEYEIPYKAIREAIVNAIAHRDYTSNAAAQVLVLADRVEVWNPGALPAGLLPESLRTSHSSIPKNPMLADPLYLTHYIEKAGSGTLDMIALCTKAELPEPDFRQDGGQFVVTLWRDWLTEEVLSNFNINERQKNVITYLRTKKRISNTEYQALFNVAKRTAHRDLDSLVKHRILKRTGHTGKGTYYSLNKGVVKVPKGSSSRVSVKSRGISKGVIKVPKGPSINSSPQRTKNINKSKKTNTRVSNSRKSKHSKKSSKSVRKK